MRTAVPATKQKLSEDELPVPLEKVVDLILIPETHCAGRIILLRQHIEKLRPQSHRTTTPGAQIMRCDSDSGKKLIKSMVLRTADRQGMC